MYSIRQVDCVSEVIEVVGVGDEGGDIVVRKILIREESTKVSG